MIYTVLAGQIPHSKITFPPTLAHTTKCKSPPPLAKDLVRCSLTKPAFLDPSMFLRVHFDPEVLQQRTRFRRRERVGRECPEAVTRSV